MMKLYLENGNHKTAIGEKSDVCYFVYSHGKLERMTRPRYDIVHRYENDVFDKETERVEDVIAVLPCKKKVPARLFYWTRKNAKYPAGLVVSLNDKENLAYAQEMFNTRADAI